MVFKDAMDVYGSYLELMHRSTAFSVSKISN